MIRYFLLFYARYNTKAIRLVGVNFNFITCTTCTLHIETLFKNSLHTVYIMPGMCLSMFMYRPTHIVSGLGFILKRFIEKGQQYKLLPFLVYRYVCTLYDILKTIKHNSVIDMVWACLPYYSPDACTCRPTSCTCTM